MKEEAKHKLSASRLRIKPLTRFSEFEECVIIQKEVWQHEDLDTTPVHQFCISVKNGGILLGDFIPGVINGFVYSFPSVFRGKLCQHSHLLAVRPSYQGLGIGKKLKWAQREEALRRGVDLITWTVDPLQAKNANLNLHTLGAVTRTYWDNFYGYTPALMLGPRIPTDRFLMEWMIRSPQVARRAREEVKRDYCLSSLPLAVEGKWTKQGKPEPKKVNLGLRDDILLVELLRDIRSYTDQPLLIARWQRAIRKALKHYFQQGYWVSDFIYGERCFYVLEKIKRLAKPGSRKKAD